MKIKKTLGRSQKNQKNPKRIATKPDRVAKKAKKTKLPEWISTLARPGRSTACVSGRASTSTLGVCVCVCFFFVFLLFFFVFFGTLIGFLFIGIKNIRFFFVFALVFATVTSIFWFFFDLFGFFLFFWYPNRVSAHRYKKH